MATILQSSKKLKRSNMILPSPKKVALWQQVDFLGAEKMALQTGLPAYRLLKIRDQVAYRILQQKICNAYEPFTSRAAKRKPRQVGA